MSSTDLSIEAQKLAQKWIEGKLREEEKTIQEWGEKWEWKERKLYGGYE